MSKSRPSRFAIVLSAFVFPGAGQVYQGRWAAAGIFGAAFLLCFVAFLVQAFRIIRVFYSLAFEFDRTDTPEIGLGAAVVWFLLAMLVYGAGLIDTQRAYLRERHRRALQRLEGGDNAV
ncbi:MAG: hypothetical protein JW951_00735 [Lentisphaerae bacterium]|nr:hypothetical protein [Lentisphaerota bacterium]